MTIFWCKYTYKRLITQSVYLHLRIAITIHQNYFKASTFKQYEHHVHTSTVHPVNLNSKVYMEGCPGVSGHALFTSG